MDSVKYIGTTIATVSVATATDTLVSVVYVVTDQLQRHWYAQYTLTNYSFGCISVLLYTSLQSTLSLLCMLRNRSIESSRQLILDNSQHTNWHSSSHRSKYPY